MLFTKKTMRYTFYNDPVQFCVIKDYYTDDEVDSIKSELSSLSKHLNEPSLTGSARGFSGEIRKNNKGLFLNDFYRNHRDSSILTLGEKLFGGVAWDLAKEHWFYKYLENAHSATLVSYYENGSYYKPHRDTSLMTAIYYIWDEPKPFEGGDIYFGDFKVPIENNSLLIFPSITQHEVKPVKGDGRWAISQFVKMRNIDEQVIFHYPSIFSVTDFKNIQNIVSSGQWEYKGRSLEGKPLFWHYELENNKYFTNYLKERIEQATGRKFSNLYRVYANGQAHGQDGEYHQDDTNPRAWTFLLYTNDIDEDIIEKWGGETHFKLPTGITSVLPVTNLAILFKSNIWHRGMGPSRHVDDLRITIAWKLIE